jgi:hypothetical protein
MSIKEVPMELFDAPRFLLRSDKLNRLPLYKENFEKIMQQRGCFGIGCHECPFDKSATTLDKDLCTFTESSKITNLTELAAAFLEMLSYYGETL